MQTCCDRRSRRCHHRSRGPLALRFAVVTVVTPPSGPTVTTVTTASFRLFSASSSLVTFLPRQPKEVLGPEEHMGNEHSGSCVGGAGGYPPGRTLMVLLLLSLFSKGATTVVKLVLSVLSVLTSWSRNALVTTPTTPFWSYSVCAYLQLPLNLASVASVWTELHRRYRRYSLVLFSLGSIFCSAQAIYTPLPPCWLLCRRRCPSCEQPSP